MNASSSALDLKAQVSVIAPFLRAIAFPSAVLLATLATSLPALAWDPTGTVTNTISLAPFTGPESGAYGAALTPDGKTLWVSAGGDTAFGLFQIDAATETLSPDYYPFNGLAFTLAFSGTGKNVYVPDPSNNQLLAVDTKTLTTLHTIDLTPYDILEPLGVTDLDGRILVTGFGSNASQFSSPSLTHVADFELPGFTESAAAIIPASGYHTARLLVPTFYFDPAASEPYPRLTIIDPFDSTIVRSFYHKSQPGVAPTAAVVTPDGQYAYIAQNLAPGKDVWIFDLNAFHTVGYIDIGDDASAYEAISPDGKYVLVAGDATNAVYVIKTRTNKVISSIPVGNGPLAVVITQDGTKAFVTNTIDGTVSVISFTPAL